MDEDDDSLDDLEDQARNTSERNENSDENRSNGSRNIESDRVGVGDPNLDRRIQREIRSTDSHGMERIQPLTQYIQKPRYEPMVPSMKNFDVEKLNDKNYKVWITDMELMLKTYQLWNTILGKKKYEGETRERNFTEEETFTAYRTIYQSVDVERKSLITDTRNPKEAWEKLENMYAPKNFIGKIQAVQDLFGVKMKENEDMIKYLDRVMDVHKTFLKAGNDDITDNLLAQLMIIGLTKEYSMVRTIVNTFKATEQTTARVREFLIAEFNNKKLEKKQEKPEKDFEALMIQKKRIFTRPEIKTCYACGKPGHMMRNCWTRNSRSENTNDRPKNVIQTRDDKRKIQDSKDKGHATTVSLGNVLIGNLDDNKWLIDSGASHHISHDITDFVELESSDETVNWGNNNCCKVTGRGTIETYMKLGDQRVNIKMENVLLVPEFKKSHIFDGYCEFQGMDLS